MPLKMAKPGKKVVLKEITWGQKLRKKLQDMGLTPGVRFDIVSATSGGPVIIDIRGTRLALGHGILSKIIVEEV
tara:strand:- start:584 stop:805 length:222 start_codon:yes stop_codon:yes gene_type:complete